MKSTYEVENNICWYNYKDDTSFEPKHELIEQISLLLDTPELQGFVLNLSVIDMLNSYGIGLLVKVNRDATNQNLKFVVLTNDYVLKIVKVLKLEEILTTAETKEEAQALILG